MKPFFTYYGGKYRSAPRYPSPRHSTIVEPFAGSAGYSVRHNAANVLLVDKDPNIVGTWRYLTRASAEELLALPDLGPDETVNDLHVAEEARILIGWWLGKGRAHPGKRPSAWMRSGVNPNSMWGPGVRRRLAVQVEEIRHWVVKEGSYADLWPGLTATWFVDPPYQYSGGSEYRFSSVDYTDLAEWCKSLRGQAIVCEGPGADWLPFEYAFYAKGTEGRGRTGVSSEFVWFGGVDEREDVA